MVGFALGFFFNANVKEIEKLPIKCRFSASGSALLSINSQGHNMASPAQICMGWEASMGMGRVAPSGTGAEKNRDMRMAVEILEYLEIMVAGGCASAAGDRCPWPRVPGWVPAWRSWWQLLVPQQGQPTSPEPIRNCHCPGLEGKRCARAREAPRPWSCLRLLARASGCRREPCQGEPLAGGAR